MQTVFCFLFAADEIEVQWRERRVLLIFIARVASAAATYIIGLYPDDLKFLFEHFSANRMHNGV